MESTAELLQHLIQLGVIVSVDGERLRLNAPKGILTSDLQTAIANQKAELIKLLREQSVQSGIIELKTLPRDRAYSLSVSQERLWKLIEAEGPSPLYNMYLAFKITGVLDRIALESSLRSLINRHESLRTRFDIVSGEPVQQVSQQDGWRLPIFDMSLDPQKESRISEIIHEAVAHKINPAKEFLFWSQLIQLEEESHILIVGMHHLISDGWSWNIFLSELSILYANHRRDDKIILTPLKAQYLEYSSWQRDFVRSPQHAMQMEFWEKTLEGALPLLLPIDFFQDSTPSFEGARRELAVPSSLVLQMRELGIHSQTSMFMILLTAFNACLSAITGQTDLLIGTPVAGRDRPVFQSIIGYFNNILPLRTIIRDGDTFTSLLSRVRMEALNCYENADIPIHQISANPNLRHLPLTRALLAIQDDNGQTLILDGTKVESIPVYNQSANFDISLTVQFLGNQLNLIAEYRISIFLPETVHTLLEDFVSLLTAAINKPEVSIRELLPNPRTHPSKGIRGSAQKDFVPPTSTVENRLVSIWEDLFHISPIGITDNFFELGGHSLMALGLFEKIKQEFNIHLPLAALLKEPTIRYLAQLIDGREGQLSWSSLVPIQPQGQRLPFFGVHGMDGNVLFWRNIAIHLGEDQPFFGLQARGIDGKSRGINSIPRMAQMYLEEIRIIQPQGPYYLGGYSLGGEISFEIAQQLICEGEQVALLVMFDTYNPVRSIRQSSSTASDVAESKTAASPGLFEILNRKLSGHLKRLKGLTLRQKAGYLVDDAVMRFNRLYTYTAMWILHRLGISPSAKLLLHYLQEVHLKAVTNHIPSIYPGRITIFRASESLADNPPESYMGWNSLAKNGIDLRVFKGSHADIYAPEHAPKIAELLHQCISQASQTG